MSLQLIIAVMLVIFIANFSKAVIGFGSGLIGMPLLSLLIGVQVATPMFALMALVGSVIIVVNNRQTIDVKAAKKLLLASLFGIPLGLYLLSRVPEAVVLSLLGLMLVSYGLYNLLAPRLPELHNDWLAYPAGFIGGILGGAYNIAGPPVLVYATLKRWPPDYFRATIQTYFLLVTVPVSLGHMLTGLWVQDVFVYFGISLLPMFAALYIGDRVHHIVPRALFARMVYVFLVGMGITLLV